MILDLQNSLMITALVIADPQIDEQHIYRKYFKFENFNYLNVAYYHVGLNANSSENRNAIQSRLKVAKQLLLR